MAGWGLPIVGYDCYVKVLLSLLKCQVSFCSVIFVVGYNL